MLQFGKCSLVRTPAFSNQNAGFSHFTQSLLENGDIMIVFKHPSFQLEQNTLQWQVFHKLPSQHFTT